MAEPRPRTWPMRLGDGERSVLVLSRDGHEIEIGIDDGEPPCRVALDHHRLDAHAARLVASALRSMADVAEALG